LPEEPDDGDAMVGCLMRSGRFCALALVGWLTLACASGPSARWKDGGAEIPIDAAYFSHAGSTIELRPSGEVMEGEALLFRIDPRGRVSDAKGHPVAVLQADGWLVAERDGKVLGWIGDGTALAADRRTERIRVLPSGDATVSGQPAGRWDYCTGPMLRTCTLVTHVVAARESGKRSSGSTAGDVVSLLQLLELAR
jgi:hypothetical protein